MKLILNHNHFFTYELIVIFYSSVFVIFKLSVFSLSHKGPFIKRKKEGREEERKEGRERSSLISLSKISSHKVILCTFPYISMEI